MHRLSGAVTLHDGVPIPRSASLWRAAARGADRDALPEPQSCVAAMLAAVKGILLVPCRWCRFQRQDRGRDAGSQIRGDG